VPREEIREDQKKRKEKNDNIFNEIRRSAFRRQLEKDSRRKICACKVN